MTKMIVSSTSFLRFLNNINTSSQSRFAITAKDFEIKEQGNVMNVNELAGEGEYTYSTDKLPQLRNCLASFSERPIVVHFTVSRICLEQISF